MELSDGIKNIKGIGDKSEKLFNKLGIFSVEELLCFYPREYDVIGKIETVRDASERCASGGMAVLDVEPLSRPVVADAGKLKIVRCKMGDESGTVTAVWFNMPFMAKKLQAGGHRILRGRIARRGGNVEINHPRILTRKEYEDMAGRPMPIYGLTAGLTNNMVQKAVRAALNETDLGDDFLPAGIREENGLMDYKDAVARVHFPKDGNECVNAKKRLAFDEFFFFSLGLSMLKKNKHKKESNYRLDSFCLADRLIDSLKFRLTAGQEGAWRDIKRDLSSGFEMNRLIQGDVGSGKTIIAVLALLSAVEGGHQGAIMAPTEALAKQHCKTFEGLFEGLNVKLCLLVGSMSASEKKKARARIESKEADIIIGTHALIQENVVFADLALAVTDEQHRFGVRQRKSFSEKGAEPHMLVMSATPIPRTLAMILYGDLDASVIDSMPAGRLPIKNCAVDESYRPRAFKFIESQIAMGRQAYVVCPLIEESDGLDAQNVTDCSNMLRRALPPDVRIDVMHGRLSPSEKNDVMEKFFRHEIDVLVSTTVIEVGIDVPNATVMMIENAERFGLAQLHQLRGRVGRGGEQSYCIFMAKDASKETMERLSILENSNDGFYVAEQDLRLRGPGDFFGIRQSGMFDFKIADIYRDADMLKAANAAAEKFGEKDIMLLCRKHDWIKRKILSYSGDVSL